MAVGGALGTSGFVLPGVEQGIAGSVAILGLLIVLAVRPPLIASVPLVVLFALLHGHAHGAEIAPATSPILYGMGFVMATALLHALGLAAGIFARSARGQTALRIGGTALACGGGTMIVSVWPL